MNPPIARSSIVALVLFLGLSALFSAQPASAGIVPVLTVNGSSAGAVLVPGQIADATITAGTDGVFTFYIGSDCTSGLNAIPLTTLDYPYAEIPDPIGFSFQVPAGLDGPYAIFGILATTNGSGPITSTCVSARVVGTQESSEPSPSEVPSIIASSSPDATPSEVPSAIPSASESASSPSFPEVSDDPAGPSQVPTVVSTTAPAAPAASQGHAVSLPNTGSGATLAGPGGPGLALLAAIVAVILASVGLIARRALRV